MHTLTLQRVGQSSRGTFGVLRVGPVPFALTLERPWVDNQPEVSCIPAGRYQCRRVRSPKFGDTFEVMDVPGRSHILFHKGNTVEDTEGCILVAEEFSGTFEAPMVVSSERGFLEFKRLLDGHAEFTLLIADSPTLDESDAVGT
jgi:Family of unknown function (DUF5675)